MSDKRKCVQKKTYVWNALAGLVNASEAVIVLAVVNRAFGGVEAGILAFAFSISNLAMTVGKFGMRTLQVTDANKENSISLYFFSRIITFFIMFFLVILYLAFSFVFKSYSIYKCHLIFLLFLLYSAEVVEDVFLSEYQRQGRLDFGAKMFTIRWFVSLVVLCFACCFVGLRRALLFANIVSFVLLCVFLLHYSKRLNISINGASIFNRFYKVFDLLRMAFPLFISSFSYLYLNNIQKFAIDKYLAEPDQAVFGYIAMPVFVLPLLSSFVIQPSLVYVTNAYHERKFTIFSKSIKKNLLFLLTMFLACEAGAFFLGVPVLNIIYKTDISVYKYDLMILLVAGAFLALANYMSVLLTIMRKQRLSMYIYLIGSLIGTITAYCFTYMFGIRGSCYSYVLTLFVTSVVFALVCCLEINRALK